ncbi:MAG: hypothetical protein QGF36_00875 [Candidatus Marinimicrobia bacterium]|jgi:uncharacterized protein (UPF0332 family)|nr:hypothetical protein [Candidatus Neomarinimicrobiota bacterium]MDP6935960.1 hypothetical protein [Candidatus Neomarinimicrobiota bacterium]
MTNDLVFYSALALMLTYQIDTDNHRKKPEAEDFIAVRQLADS